jgi:hypothetical protein
MGRRRWRNGHRPFSQDYRGAGWGIVGMSFIFHFVAGVLVFFGAVSLITTFFAEERDGSRLVVRTVRAVGFILLAGVLNGYT